MSTTDLFEFLTDKASRVEKIRDSFTAKHGEENYRQLAALAAAADEERQREYARANQEIQAKVIGSGKTESAYMDAYLAAVPGIKNRAVRARFEEEAKDVGRALSRFKEYRASFESAYGDAEKAIQEYRARGPQIQGVLKSVLASMDSFESFYGQYKDRVGRERQLNPEASEEERSYRAAAETELGLGAKALRDDPLSRSDVSFQIGVNPLAAGERVLQKLTTTPRRDIAGTLAGVSAKWSAVIDKDELTRQKFARYAQAREAYLNLAAGLPQYAEQYAKSTPGTTYDEAVRALHGVLSDRHGALSAMKRELPELSPDPIPVPARPVGAAEGGAVGKLLRGAQLAGREALERVGFLDRFHTDRDKAAAINLGLPPGEIRRKDILPGAWKFEVLPASYAALIQDLMSFAEFAPGYATAGAFAAGKVAGRGILAGSRRELLRGVAGTAAAGPTARAVGEGRPGEALGMVAAGGGLGATVGAVAPVVGRAFRGGRRAPPAFPPSKPLALPARGEIPIVLPARLRQGEYVGPPPRPIFLAGQPYREPPGLPPPSAPAAAQKVPRKPRKAAKSPVAKPGVRAKPKAPPAPVARLTKPEPTKVVAEVESLGFLAKGKDAWESTDKRVNISKLSGKFWLVVDGKMRGSFKTFEDAVSGARVELARPFVPPVPRAAPLREPTKPPRAAPSPVAKPKVPRKAPGAKPVPEKKIARPKAKIITGEIGKPEKTVERTVGAASAGELLSPVPVEGLGTPLERARQAIAEAKPLRSEQEALYRAERGRRIAKAEAIGARVPGEAGFIAQKRALKGPLPKILYQSIRGRLSQEELDKLYQGIEKSRVLDGFEKIGAKEGLTKLFGPAGVQVPQDSEIELLGRVFGEEFARAIAAKRAGHSVLLQNIADIIGVSRVLRSMGDLSASLRQGLFFTTRYNPQWRRAFVEQLRDWSKESNYQALKEEIVSRTSYRLMRRSGLALTALAGGKTTAREEVFASANIVERLAGKTSSNVLANMGLAPVRLIGRYARASDRAYTGFLTKLRADIFDEMVRRAGLAGYALDDALHRDIASAVNAGTGRGGLAAFEPAGKALATALFSPRLVASRLRLINPATYIRGTEATGRLGITSPYGEFVRSEMLKSALGLVALGNTVLGLAWLAGAAVEVDPRSSDWGKIRLGKTRVDVWGGLQQYARILSQVLSGEIKSTTTGRMIKLGEGYRPLTRWDIATSFLEQKAAPVPGFAVNVLKGRDVTGQPIRLKQEILDLFVPLFIADLYDVARTYPTLIPVGLLGTLGVGVQTYPLHTTRATDAAVRILAKKGEKSKRLEESIKEIREAKTKRERDRAVLEADREARRIIGKEGWD